MAELVLESSFFLVIGDQVITRRHRLAGTVTVDGVPAKRIIAVIDRRDFSWVASTSSDPVTGAWEIKGMPEFAERSLAIIAFDNAGNFNAEVADYITQVTS